MIKVYKCFQKFIRMFQQLFNVYFFNCNSFFGFKNVSSEKQNLATEEQVFYGSLIS